MRRWYEPRKDRPDLERSAIRKRGFVGYMDMLWREFFELLKLNLLFVLSCVPIITIPAALTAMHRITSVMVRDENHFLWPDYWKAFRRDFWKSLGGGAAIAAVMALFVLSTVFYYNLMQVNKVFVLLAGFAACVVLLTLCVSFYFFPMLAMVDLPLGALLKNSMALVFGNIGKTLLALLLFVLLIARRGAAAVFVHFCGAHHVLVRRVDHDVFDLPGHRGARHAPRGGTCGGRTVPDAPAAGAAGGAAPLGRTRRAAL